MKGIASNLSGWRWILALALLGGVGSATPAACWGQAPSENTWLLATPSRDPARLLEGLRQRRLFELARDYCQTQLASESLTDIERANLTVQLMQTQTAEAMLAAPELRPALWQAVAQTAETFLQRPDPPRAVLVRLQQALAHVAHANLIRQELAADMTAPEQRQAALAELREARSQLDQLERDLRSLLPARKDATPAGPWLTTNELLALANNVGFQLARCNLIRSQLVDPQQRADRLDALQQAQSQLAVVSRAVSPGQTLWWQTRLAQLEGYRLAERMEDAVNVAQELQGAQDTLPAELRDAWQEQRLRLILAGGNRAELEREVRPLLAQGERSPLLDLALIEASLALAEGQGNPNPRQWLQTASALASEVESRHGAYWRRRADRILIGAVGTAPEGSPTMAAGNSPELDVLLRVAGNAAEKQRYPEALAAYDRAAATAAEQNNPEIQFRSQVAAGQMLEKLQRRQEAAQRFVTLAQTQAQHPGAAAVHLRGCWNLAQLASVTGPDQAAQRLALNSALEDHLQRWPGSSTTAQARYWLAESLTQSGQPQAALEAYLSLPAASPLAVTGMQRALPLTDQQLAQDRARWSLLEASWQQRAEGLPSESEAGQYAQLVLAHLRLRWRQEVPAGQLLAQLDPKSSQPLVQALALVARVGDPAAAESGLEAVAGEPLAMDLAFHELQALALADSPPAPPEQIRQLNRTLCQAAAAAAAPAAAAIWRLRRADLEVALGNTRQALEELEAVAQQFPNHAEVLLKLARAETAVHETTSPKVPLERWRRLAARLPPHTDRWYEAKYEVARLLAASGDREGALKLLRYLQAIPPGWDQAPQRESFERLMQELGG